MLMNSAYKLTVIIILFLLSSCHNHNHYVSSESDNTHLVNGKLINKVMIEKDKVCSGESLLISVEKAAQVEDVEVSINGKLGASHYIQFPGAPGKRAINIYATAINSPAESINKEIEVIKCSDTKIFPVIAYEPNTYKEFSVNLGVKNADKFTSNDENVSYFWVFGDGQTLETNKPFVIHDYSNSINSDEPYSVFNMSVTVRRKNMEDSHSEKSLTLDNIYFQNKQLGFIQPKINASRFLSLGSSSNYQGDFEIENVESEKINISKYIIEYRNCDSQISPRMIEENNLSLEVDANSSIRHVLSLGAIEDDICDVFINLIGKTTSSLGVYANLYYKVPQRVNKNQKELTDINKISILNAMVEQGVAKDPNNITGQEYQEYIQSGLFSIKKFKNNSKKTTKTQNEVLFKDGVLGETCESGETPPRQGVSCQSTGKWTFTEPEVINAKKGDIILSSGCGQIGQLLRQVTPPQRYSHSGIFTEDYKEIRHSTASEDRYMDYLIGTAITGEQGTDAIRKDVIRYGWPGTITQTVDAAFNGEPLIDPESGKVYNIHGFSSSLNKCSGDATVTYPVIVKPSPEYEASVRPILENVAEIAKGINSHYRFYAYTDANIYDNSEYDGSSGTGWATGTPSTMCSSYIWTALKKAGVRLEGDELEGRDIIRGAQLDNETLDGLYFYTEQERRTAANWMYNNYYDEAFDKSGELGRTFYDIPDDVASQITNCFANDNCDKDSDAWESPGVGRTVSVDDILFWDSPETGGVYGFSEQVIYKDSENKAITQWMPSVGTGGISGIAKIDGYPIDNITVSINGLEFITKTDGVFSDDAIPAGTYPITAVTTVNGIEYRYAGDVNVEAGITTNIIIDLKTTSDIYKRKVTISGNMFINDDENFFADESENFLIDRVYYLSPEDRTIPIPTISHCVGDEVRVELDLSLTLEADNETISAIGSTAVYEGTSCGTNKKIFESTINKFKISNNETVRVNTIRLGDNDSDGSTIIDLEVSNTPVIADADADDNSKYAIDISGNMFINDDENFVADESENFSINESFTLSTQNFQIKIPTIKHCAGAEVRVELDLILTLRNDKTVLVSGSTKLFEGTNCETTKLIDSKQIDQILIVPNTTVDVPSIQLGTSDFTKIDLKLTNTAIK